MKGCYVYFMDKETGNFFKTVSTHWNFEQQISPNTFFLKTQSSLTGLSRYKQYDYPASAEYKNPLQF